MIDCIAIDDEPLALKLVEDNIRKISFLNLVKLCTRVSEAMEIMSRQKIDLIFLDIRMPDISGIQFLRSLKQKPMTVIVTAHENFALEGFELDVLDYLLKPVSFDRFLKAAHKALEYYQYKNSASEGHAGKTKYFFVKADYKIVKINVDEILYLEGLKDYVKIYTGDKPVITLSTLKAMEDKLPEGDFVRVHKSFIIAVSKIHSLTKNYVVVGSREIPLSDSYRDSLFKIIRKDYL